MGFIYYGDMKDSYSDICLPVGMENIASHHSLLQGCGFICYLSTPFGDLFNGVLSVC